MLYVMVSRMKNDGNDWQNFCSLYYEQAMGYAQYHISKLKRSLPHWDERIDEEALTVDAAMEALQKVFTQFEPARGASLGTFLSRVVHNELLREFERETKSLAMLNDVSTRDEAEYSLGSLSARIPDNAMDSLKQKLRAAILKLSPLDQCILEFFLEDPSTFIDRAVKELNVTRSFVSIHKCRALDKLPSLMGISAEDYYEMYDEPTFMSRKPETVPSAAPSRYRNPIFPEFDIESTVSKLYDAIRGDSEVEVDGES